MKDGAARRGVLCTPQGSIQTPAFMNVATAGAIKGGLGSEDLENIGCQVMLCNTYHLHIRPGDAVVARLGGLPGFTKWRGPTLTDSGGFQVFSLAKLRDIREEGVTFASHISGARIFIGPEESMRIQHNLGASIAMAFDECAPNTAGAAYVEASCARTTRWLARCKTEHARLRETPDSLCPRQMLFGINQGGAFTELRKRHMDEIVKMELDGYAIGGLAVGESKAEMLRVISTVTPLMPHEKVRYLMGVGTPGDILEAVRRGVDLFDCVLPARNARHGHVFTKGGKINLNNAVYAADAAPIDKDCACPVCAAGYARGYLRHLLKAGEALGLRLCVTHNLWFYNHFMKEIRTAIENHRFDAFHALCAANGLCETPVEINA